VVQPQGVVHILVEESVHGADRDQGGGQSGEVSSAGRCGCVGNIGGSLETTEVRAPPELIRDLAPDREPVESA
jgi:hypothetical protein